MSEQKEELSVNWRILTPLLIVVAIDAMGGGIVMPLLPFYSTELGANPFVIGLLISAFSICQFLSGPFWGRLSDQYGRKKILLISQLGTFLSFVILALAPNMLFVFAGRMLDGLTSGNMSIAMAMASDSSGPSTRKQALGAVSAALGVGVILGPSLSAFLSHESSTLPLWVASALSLLSILAAAQFLPQEKKSGGVPPKPEKVWTVLSSPGIKNLFTLILCLFFPMSLFVSGFALYLAASFTWDGKPFGAREVGVLFTIFAAVNIFVQFVLIKRFSKWMSDRSIALFGFALMILSFCGIGSTDSVVVLACCLAVIAVATSLLRPTLSSILSLRTPPSQLGLVMGAHQSLVAGVNIVAPLISGALIHAKLYGVWILGMAAVAALGLLLSSRLKPMESQTD